MKHYQEPKIIRILRIYLYKIWIVIESYISKLYDKMSVILNKWDNYWDAFQSASISDIEKLNRRIKLLEIIIIISLVVEFGMGIVLITK